MTKKHVLSIIAENKSGVLLRVVGLFSRRGYSIESISAAETEHPEISRMTIVTEGDDASVEQICKQLQKLIEIKAVRVLSAEEAVKREHVLICAGNSEENCSALIQVANLFHAKILNVSDSTLMLELAGKPRQVDAFIKLVQPFGITKMIRSGLIALERN